MATFSITTAYPGSGTPLFDITISGIAGYSQCILFYVSPDTRTGEIMTKQVVNGQASTSGEIPTGVMGMNQFVTVFLRNADNTISFCAALTKKTLTLINTNDNVAAIAITSTPTTNTGKIIGGAGAIDMSLQNIGTIQQIKYALNAGAETTLAAGASANITGIMANSTLKVNPILTPRPIHFTSNGRVQKITYNAIDYNVFPTDINVDVSGTPTLDIAGNPAPEITVNYTDTSEPVITDT